MRLNNQLLNQVKESYIDQFGAEPLLIRAPGRINLIGEHTDYNDGFVLPAATDQAIYLAIGKADISKSTLVSLDMEETLTFDIEDFGVSENKPWANYILGVIAEVRKVGYTMKNFNMVFSGDLPRGSGMSSSAALECGTCFGINELFKFDISKLDMIKMAQKAEHHFVGVMCGIMDQFASMMGAADQAMLLDCRSLEFSYFPIALKDYSLVLCNSNVSHSLAESEYNNRRQQAEQGVSILREFYPHITALRDVSMEQLQTHKKKLTDLVYRRCKYIIEESERVISMTKAMEVGDFRKIGEVLKEGQKGMQFEYEITCPEIDFMADFANERKDVLGARMMGGGFGGCTINFLKKGTEDEFVDALNVAYKNEFNIEITPIQVIISDGVKRIS